MRLPQIARIIVEDLPSNIQDWITKVTNPINSFMLSIKNGLNKGITVNDNLSGAIKTLEVSNNAIKFSYISNRPPKIVCVGGWIDRTDTTWTPSTGVCVDWEYADNEISCTFYGLNTAHKYYVNLIILDD